MLFQHPILNDKRGVSSSLSRSSPFSESLSDSRSEVVLVVQSVLAYVASSQSFDTIVVAYAYTTIIDYIFDSMQ